MTDAPRPAPLPAPHPPAAPDLAAQVPAPGSARPRNTPDLVATVALLAVAHVAIGYVNVSVASIWCLALLTCLDGCDLPGMTDAALLAASAPGTVLSVALAGSIVLLRFRRIAFWVPLVGGGAAIALAVWTFGEFLAVV
jgi:hypothetical protein